MSSTNFFRFFSIVFFGVALLAACSGIKTSVETVKAESADVVSDLSERGNAAIAEQISHAVVRHIEQAKA